MVMVKTIIKTCLYSMSSIIISLIFEFKDTAEVYYKLQIWVILQIRLK